jgi:hypothetical protein
MWHVPDVEFAAARFAYDNSLLAVASTNCLDIFDVANEK